MEEEEKAIYIHQHVFFAVQAMGPVSSTLSSALFSTLWPSTIFWAQHRSSWAKPDAQANVTGLSSYKGPVLLVLHRSSWQEVVRAKSFPQLSKVREMARHRGLLEQFSSQFEEICSELFLPHHQAWLIWEKCPVAKWQTLHTWHRLPGHSFGQKSLPRRSLLKKAGCKDFILCGFVLWQVHASALLHVCPTALCHSAAPGSSQASPVWDRELWLPVQADAGLSPARCSLAGSSPAATEEPAAHGQEAEHSYASSEGKERRNLGWVRTEGIYQYREFFTYYLLSHTHTHACTRQPSIFTQAQKGHQSIIHPSGFPGSLKQTEVTFKRTPSSSTHRMLCP